MREQLIGVVKMSSSVEGIRRANDAHAQHAPGHRNKLPTVAGAANRLVCGILIASMTAPFCFVPVQGHMINVSGSGTAHMAGPIWHLMDDLKNQAKQDIEMTYRYCTATTTSGSRTRGPVRMSIWHILTLLCALLC